MPKSRLLRLLNAPNTMMALLLLAGGVLVSNNLSAEEIEFRTKDGKHQTRGTIDSFVNANGETTKLPRSITPDTQVVIRQPDGTKTPPIKLANLSNKTRTAITKFVAQSRKEDKPEVDQVTAFFLKNRPQLMDLASQYKDLGPINQVDPATKEQYLTELRDFKKDLGPDLKSDWATRFMLAYLEGEYGANKYGEVFLIAKDTQNFWTAWQAAVVFSLRYRDNLDDCMKLMDQYLVALSDFRKQHAKSPDKARLQKAGHAALWLREAASFVENSSVANDAELKRLKQIQTSSTVTTLIKTSEIPDAVLDQAEERRLIMEKERREAEAEAHRIKQLALDKRIRECRNLLERFIESYERQWDYGMEAFERQELITDDAARNFDEIDLRWRTSSRNHTEWSIIANRNLGDDPTDAEIRYQQHAQDRASFYLRERNRASYERNVRWRVLNTERQRLANAHATLADFVNRGKNQLILFENNYVDTIKADPTLKQDYLKFTDKVKAVIARLPPMPTVRVTPQNKAKVEAQALAQELQAKLNELSFSLQVDLQGFLEQLSPP